MQAALIVNVTKQAASSHHGRMDVLTTARSDDPASGRPARRIIGSACARRRGQAALAGTMAHQSRGLSAEDVRDSWMSRGSIAIGVDTTGSELPVAMPTASSDIPHVTRGASEATRQE